MMSPYEEIKSKAPHFMMLVQKSRILSRQGKLEEAYKIADESLNALDLVEEHPNVLAAYVVATNVFQNYAEVLSSYANYAVPTACKGVIRLMAPFLCKNTQNENCMSLLLTVIQPLYFSVMELFAEEDTRKTFVNNGEDYSGEVVCISASMLYSAFNALKSINPRSPMVESLQSFINEIPDTALLFTSVSRIPEYADRLYEILA